jgi:hypothetical protein
VVVNPNSGPDGRPDLPDEQYQRAIPYLQGFQNVTLVGYISTVYAKRDIQHSIADIETYWKWNSLKEDMGVDGIFIDEVDNEGVHFEYFDVLSKHIKSKPWKFGKPGTFPRDVIDGRLCDSESGMCTEGPSVLQYRRFSYRL